MNSLNFYGLIDVRKILGSRIKHYRKLRGITQRALGIALNADKGTIWRWEKGHSWPEYPALEALSRELKIDVSRLFSDISETPPPPDVERALEVLSEFVKKNLDRP